MDENVQAALRKWPNVPDCYDWLNLDLRGRYRLGPWPGTAIDHPALNDFISRNYLRHSDGRYIFQNGPQRVFVRLAYTPYILRLADANSLQLRSHCGQAAGPVSHWFSDEAGHLLADTALGIGLIDGRDTSALITRLEAGGSPLNLRPILRAQVAPRFGFVAQPATLKPAPQ